MTHQAGQKKQREQMEKRILELGALIRETKARLPAHSVKPPVMMDLLALEDELYELTTRMEKLDFKSD